jgi:viroplasmin and RNaseH domain-containing protein
MWVEKRHGIYTTWIECESQVVGFHGTLCKSLRTLRKVKAYVNTNSLGSTWWLKVSCKFKRTWAFIFQTSPC